MRKAGMALECLSSLFSSHLLLACLSIPLENAYFLRRRLEAEEAAWCVGSMYMPWLSQLREELTTTPDLPPKHTQAFLSESRGSQVVGVGLSLAGRERGGMPGFFSLSLVRRQCPPIFTCLPSFSSTSHEALLLPWTLFLYPPLPLIMEEKASVMVVVFQSVVTVAW